MLDRHWHFEKGEYWDCSDVEIWRRRLKSPWPTDPTAELSEVLRGGQVPLIGIPIQPNILWPEERRGEFFQKERVGSGPKQNGAPMPTSIPPEYLAEVDLHVSASGGAAELWWNCGLPAWRFVHFARDELIRAYMAYLEQPPVVAASDPLSLSSDAPPTPAPAAAHSPTASPPVGDQHLQPPEAQNREPQQGGEADARPKRQRLEKGHWAWARPQALDWLEEEGAPAELGDQAKLEKFIVESLAQRGSHPAESTVRQHVVRWIKEFKERREKQSY